MNLRVRMLIALSGAALGLTACAAILGIEEGIPDQASGDAGDEGQAADAISDAPPCTPDAAEKPDEGAGVFVSGDLGVDDTACGGKARPCATIQAAIDRATSVVGKTIIYVAHGDYRETITMKPGLTIDGGWQIIGADWLRDCSATPSQAVRIFAPNDQPATVVADFDGGAKIRVLTLGSKDKADAGESLYGVFARGIGTTLTLESVVLNVAHAGDGIDGKTGATGDAGVGSCAAADGGTGAPSNALGLGGDAGSFGPNGYTAIDGVGVGGNGSLGNAGLAPDAPACATCFGCTALVCGSANGTSCGTIGASGCPGAGGVGGAPGTGGGSSVGVFAWNANVTLANCTLSIGNGGAGGNGGLGGPGGAGAFGAEGGAGPACNVCNGAVCAQGTGAPGATGGRGGTGGVGARGGGGAGGWSVGIVQVGDAGQVIVTDVNIQKGDAGASRGNGAPGRSVERLP